MLLVAVVLMTALTGYAGWWFGVGRYTSAPGLLNQPFRVAAAKAADQGLRLQVTERRFSETVTAGSVISTDPPAGARVLEGGTIDAVVSKGPERYAVPVLRKRPLSEVADRLAQAQLGLGVVTKVWSADVAKGLVISSSPRAGFELRKGMPVGVRVSKGPRPIRIPDFTGKSARRAEQRLTELGFDVRSTRANSDSVPSGKVISQNPAGGRGFRNDTIELVVSKGPVMVTVPDLRTKSVAEATVELTSLGLRIRTVRTGLYIGVDRVVRQTPGSGESIPKGSVVTVYVV